MSTLNLVPMPVEYQPCWLSWVAATTGCLRALGVDCDQADVAGYSGYGFVMNVEKGLCPSGPTCFPLGLLIRGIPALGRSPLAFNADLGLPSDETQCRVAYDLVAREIEAGRPCVIWGAYMAEFAIAKGVEDGAYHVASLLGRMGRPQPPVRYDGLDAPGGPYVLAFPAAVEFSRRQADRFAIDQALHFLYMHAGWPSQFAPDYGAGQKGYAMWIAALQNGQPFAFGAGYNANCWAEARRLAHQFLVRLAGRNADVAAPLERSAAVMAQTAEALTALAKLYPFPGDQEHANDPATRAQGVELLRVAASAEAQAAEALADAAAAWKRDSK